MEGVQIEQLASGASIGEPIMLSTSDRVMDSTGEYEGDEMHGIQGAMNGQLEIEIPAGEARQGAIHTIQLQSPGGNTHIVEGLVVSNTTHGAGGGDGVDPGTETALFHSNSGTFLLPTSHAASLANSGLITSPSGGGTCEVITGDPSDHHILSGLQVVRVTTGENCETIFLVPSTGNEKDGMQPVMVLQSAEELGEEHAQAVSEVVEETVELNIPSPKPILTTVKQEMEAASSDRTIVVGDGSRERTIVVGEAPSSSSPTTLVVVSSETSNNESGASCSRQTVVGNQGNAAVEPPEKKPALSAVNGHAPTPTPSRNPRLPNSGIGIAADDDRPKRKAAIKAVATRKAALASLTSPRKHSSSPKSPRKSKAATVVVPPPPVLKPAPMLKELPRHPSPTRTLQVIQPPTPTRVNTVTVNATPSPFSSSNTTLLPTSLPPPPPPVIQTIPQVPQRVIIAGGTPIHATPRSYFLMPEDLVSESDEEGEGAPQRKCCVCLRRRRFTEVIFDMSRSDEPGGSTTKKYPLVQNVEMLLAHLKLPINVQALSKKPHDAGICTSCLDSLQRWHVFTSAMLKRHEAANNSGTSFDESPVNWEPFETRVYRNYRKMSKVKEVYHSATHSHYTRRHFTEKDWDYFCDHLFRFNSLKSERARELERYVMCREKLTHLYCIKCQRLIKNGRKGFVKHMRTQHPHDSIMLPCDICGSHFPEKDASPSTEEYYPHWISHFYFHECDECGKRFPTKRALGQHKQGVHKTRNAQWNKSAQESPSGSGEDRPWKCDQCGASFKMKGALVSHRDVVHYNRKNHVCNICGEAFKSASSLRGHVRRHEGRRDYKCEVCQKEYYTYSALKGHKVVHQTARDFICGICGKAFKKKKALEEHGTLHTGVKPHRCPICGREIRVKSNLYKHMKIHKKNAELGIITARGRHGMTSTTSTISPTLITSSVAGNSSSLFSPLPSTSTQPPPKPVGRGAASIKKTKSEPKVKIVKVEQRELAIKQEPGFFSQSNTVVVGNNGNSSSSSTSIAASSSSSTGVKMTSSPIQGSTAVDVVLENAELPGTDHRGPIVVSIVTDALGGGPANILHMNQDQQQQLLNVVTSLANSHGQTITMAGAGGATFIASPMTSSGVATARNSLVATTASSSDRADDQILAVPTTTQYYTTQQFFNSLDQLQN